MDALQLEELKEQIRQELLKEQEFLQSEADDMAAKRVSMWLVKSMENGQWSKAYHNSKLQARKLMPACMYVSMYICMYVCMLGMYVC